MHQPIRRRASLPDSAAPFDSRLLGYWQEGGDVIEIAGDHWLYMSGRAPVAVAADGRTMTCPASDPAWSYARVAGEGPTLVGIWEIRYRATNGDDPVAHDYVEEVNFRRNGTYNWQTWIDGRFDSELLGTWRVEDGKLVTRERRAGVRTDQPGRIAINVLFGTEIRGTYLFAPDGKGWTLTEEGGGLRTYLRAAGPFPLA